MQRDTLLIEIGCEELPAGAVSGMADFLATQLTERLRAQGLHVGAAQALHTPRRIACLLQDVDAEQGEQTVEKRGPAVKAAFDENGQPSQAAQAFAKSCGVTVDALQRLTTPKGEWLLHRASQPGRALPALLAELLPALVQQMPMPKRMRWGSGDDTFLRPVRWLLALHGETVLPLSLFGFAAGRETRGHRFHAPQPQPLSHADQYIDTLEQAYVLVDPAQRRERIRAQVQAQADASAAQVLIDADLLDEINCLVEWPVAMMGRFDEEFLQVPKEALILTMKQDQRYFPLLRDDGSLYPGFITVTNLDSQAPQKVIEGNERVIRPRLADARFFFEQDRKQPLATRLDGLRRVVFQEQLGSLYDRSERLVRLSRHLAGVLQIDAVLVERAAWMSKCDLLTEMVYEFPELQGIAGKYYVLAEGESRSVADALEQQYWPKQAGDAIADNPVARVLALADKLDLLAGIFAIGQRPSGTKDPFGLRRAALGVLRIVIEGELDLDLREALSEAASALPLDWHQRDAGVQQALTYTLERLPHYYSQRQLDSVLVEAVLATEAVRPLDIARRVEALQNFLRHEDAEAVCAANKRVGNILRKNAESVPDSALDPALLQAAEEQKLAAALQEVSEQFVPACQQRRYGEGLQALAALRAPADAFFDSVMVMCDDAALRRNRLALLRDFHQLCNRVADLSMLSPN